MTHVYNKFSLGTMPPFGGVGGLVHVYEDKEDGGFCKIFRVISNPGDSVEDASANKKNQGRDPRAKTATLLTVILSGQTVVEELDDQGATINTVVTTAGDKGAWERSQRPFFGGIRITTPVATERLCLNVAYHDVTACVSEITPATDNIEVPPPDIAFLWEGSATKDGQSYAAPYVFYGEAGVNDDLVADVECKWERLTVVARF